MASEESGKFYTTKGNLGFCSNFYRAPITLEGKEWMTTEHYYQAQKSNNAVIREMIRESSTPKIAATLGRAIEIRPDWEDFKEAYMYRAVYAKFEQHKDLRDKLLATGDIELIEDTVGSLRPDAVWGNGADGKGQNLLGKILMDVRTAMEILYAE